MLKKYLVGIVILMPVVWITLSLSGCFENPTSPGNPFNSVSQGSPSATPTPGTDSQGHGAITGTISHSDGGLVNIAAINDATLQTYYTTRTGNGTYTISNLPNGTYTVEAGDHSWHSAVSEAVLINGNSVTVNLVLH